MIQIHSRIKWALPWPLVHPSMKFQENWAISFRANLLIGNQTELINECLIYFILQLSMYSKVSIVWVSVLLLIGVFLSRFAQFFLCPLFDESCKDREVNAVDSEHEKNLMNDAWRLFQLEKATGNPSHPFSKFGTGNLKA